MTGKPTTRAGTRPAAAGMATDAESGIEGLDSAAEVRKSLHALKVMFDRGLIPEAEYRKRVAALGWTPPDGPT